MADLIIKGMEMPLRCFNCPFETYYRDGSRCRANRGNKIEWDIGNDRGRDCPLRPLPEKHGRLGDLDALEEKFRAEALLHTSIGDLNRMTLGGGEVIDRIKTAPTIVPAEGVTDDVQKQ